MKKKSTSKTITIIALAVLLILAIRMVNSGGSIPEVKDKNLDAYVVAEESVKVRLKSPATANFPSYSHAKITEKDNNYWQISSIVDSQNSFGAMLRSNWTVELIFLGGDPDMHESWKISDVIIQTDNTKNW